MDLVRFAGLLHPDQTPFGGSVPLSQLFALHELDIGVPLSQQELAGRLRLDKSTLSRLVVDMEHRGLVLRERDPANRRFYRLQLTDRGRAVHAELGTMFHERYVRLVSGISAPERDALLTGLPALIRAVRSELS